MKWEVNWLYHRRLGLFFNSIWLDPSTNCKILPKYVERKNAKQIYLQKPPQHGVGMPWTTTKRIRSSAFNANEMKLKEFHLTAKQNSGLRRRAARETIRWISSKMGTIVLNVCHSLHCLQLMVGFGLNGSRGVHRVLVTCVCDVKWIYFVGCFCCRLKNVKYFFLSWHSDDVGCTTHESTPRPGKLRLLFQTLCVSQEQNAI